MSPDTETGRRANATVREYDRAIARQELIGWPCLTGVKSGCRCVERFAQVIANVRAAERGSFKRRPGAALSTVISILPQQPEWSVHDLLREVAARGVVASKKEIYNALGYLNRKGKVSRISYGRYSIPENLS